jgi:hypothetical protein
MEVLNNNLDQKGSDCWVEMDDIIQKYGEYTIIE